MKPIYQKIFCLVLFICISFSITAQTKRYVRENGTGNGLSWEDASGSIQDMITASAAGDSVFVMKGIYTRAAGTFFIRMKEGVKVYGSFQGSESSLNERIIGASAADSSKLDGNGRLTISNNSALTAASVLDGFFVSNTTDNNINNTSNASPLFANLIIADGNGGNGGGMYNQGSSPTLNNVIFRNNHATGNGGGMYNWSSSDPVLTNVIFEHNTSTMNGGGIYNQSSTPVLTNVIFRNNVALSGGGMFNSGTSPTLNDVSFERNTAGRGGGLYNYLNANPVLNDVRITGNQATEATIGYGGGGMMNHSASPVLNRVFVSGNSSGSEGGGISNRDNAHPTLNNVVISGNYSERHGGGFYINTSNAGDNPTFTNVTVAGNYAATSGGGIYNGSNITFRPLVRNSIVYGNNAPLGPNLLSTDDITFTNSLVQGSGGSAAWGSGFGTDGGNNLDADPLFVNHKPAAATGATEGGNYRLKDNSSPAADAGSNDYSDSYGSKDVSGGDRVQNGIVNMGAFEAFNMSLPVNYGAISAYVSNNILTVIWETLTESNTDHFEVETSVDGKHFTKMGTVTSKVISVSASRHYEFNIKTTMPTAIMGMGSLILLLGSLMPRHRNRKLIALSISFIFFSVTFISCNKNKDAIDISSSGDNSRHRYARVVQVDKDGKKLYSKIVAVAVKE